MSSESIAEAFHDAYEDLAVGFGQRPRETAKPWMSVPSEYRQLLTATFERLIQEGVIIPGMERRSGGSVRGSLSGTAHPGTS